MSERGALPGFGGVVLAGLRIMYGLLWLQQTTWKVPPDFGRRGNGGLWYWTQESVNYSVFPPHRFFLEHVVIPHFVLFGYLTLATELFIGLTHVLGIASRLAALVAFGMSVNITLGLIRHPSEWPWSYVMLVGYSVLFLALPPGRRLGLDAVLEKRLKAGEPSVSWRRWLRLIT